MENLELSREGTEQAIASIRRYFADELDQELGELPARLLLEFFLREIGPSVYNTAIADAQTYLRDRLADMEGVCYAEEFTYWARRPGKRGAR